MATTINQLGHIQISSDGYLYTPNGACPIQDATITTTPGSIPNDNGSLNIIIIVVAVILALPTLGFSLFLLFALKGRRYPADTVTVTGPTFAWTETAVGGVTFATWVSSWNRAIEAAA